MKSQKSVSEELFKLDLPNSGPWISKHTIVVCLILTAFSVWSFSRSIWIAFCFYQILILTNILLSAFFHIKRKKLFESYRSILMLQEILKTPLLIKKKYNSVVFNFSFPSKQIIERVKKSEFK